MKILNSRLSHIFSAKEILSKHNYAGLPGDDTQGPIHIINNIMEDTRANKRELWLMFQDMSKAFDSVNSDCLVLALRRIKAPEWFIHLMKNLLNNRENIVLTMHGNTDPYKVEDGLDQGDIISPLMWRIFYDPLISHIAKSGLGYTMNECWTNDLCLKTQVNINLEVAVAAYVDDTNWFAPNRSNMEQILNIANEFYTMNDIAINKSKSYLIAINTNKNHRDSGLIWVKRFYSPSKKIIPFVR